MWMPFSIVLQLSGHEPKYCTNSDSILEILKYKYCPNLLGHSTDSVNLTAAVERKVCMNYPLGTMNVKNLWQSIQRLLEYFILHQRGAEWRLISSQLLTYCMCFCCRLICFWITSDWTNPLKHTPPMMQDNTGCIIWWPYEAYCMCVCVWIHVCTYTHAFFHNWFDKHSIRCLTKTAHGSHLLNDVAAGIHFVLTGVDERGEFGNEAGMCGGC